MDIQNEMTYDSVFWAGVTNMKDYLIPLVNETFGTHFTDKAKVQLVPGKLANQMPDESFKRGELDAYVILSEMAVSKRYHFEVETRGNRGIFIRIAEYALGIAKDNIEVTDRGIEVTMPHSAVIFLKNADTMPDRMSIIFKGDSGELVNNVPVIKIRDYSVSDLFEKKLLLLLPFYGFNFDGRFPKMNEDGIGELKSDFDDINERLLKMLNVHKDSLVIDHKGIYSAEKFLGILKSDEEGNKKFYFSSASISNKIVSSYNENADNLIKAQMTSFESCLKLEEVLLNAGAVFEKSEDTDWDINLDPQQVSKDTIMNLLVK